MYDSIKPVLLVGTLEGNFLASFMLGWAVTTGAGIASYPLDTVRRRMMMTSGEVSSSNVSFCVAKVANLFRSRPSSTSHPWMLPVKSLLLRVSGRSSRVPVLTSSVVSLVLVSCPCTTKSSFSSSERPSRVVPVKRLKPSNLQNSCRWMESSTSTT